MSRKLLSVALLAAVPLTPMRAQEQQQSLGDIARQARKAKQDQARSAGAPKSVITEDSFSGSHAAGSPSPTPLDNPDASVADRLDAARAKLDQADGALDRLEPLDRSALARFALGHNSDFPGRGAWEDKLFSAKQDFVSHCRTLLRETRQVLDEAQSLAADDKTPATKSRAQDLALRARQLMQDAYQTEANFQAVILEGQRLANQPAAPTISSSN